MKTLLIIWLTSGDGFAIPFASMEACLSAEQGLDTASVESSRCEYDHLLTEDEG